MKKYFFGLAALILVTITELRAQREINHGPGLGFQINQFQRDFGLGVQMTSPYFFWNKVAVRLKGNLMYNEHVDGSETVWTPYSNVSLGMVGGSGRIGESIRLYGEGGVIGLFPSAEFSSEDFVFGGYGLFGFEFFLSRASSYFIEIGGVGTGATADNIPNNPIYSNGLSLSVGYRITFKSSGQK